MRFGRIAEEADEFQSRIWGRITQRAMIMVFFSRREVWSRVRRTMRLRLDLFRMDTPPEMVELVKEELTKAEEASPYAAITTARFSLPELAKHTIRELNLNLDELEAIESLIETRRQLFVDSTGKTLLVFALAVLSLLCGEIPDEVITRLGLALAAFKFWAFWGAAALVGIALYVTGVEFLVTGRVGKQARISSRLVVYCRAELKARGAAA